MKISEEELIEELESLRDNAQDDLDRWQRRKLSQNTPGVVMRIAERDTAINILKLIREGFDA